MTVLRDVVRFATVRAEDAAFAFTGMVDRFLPPEQHRPARATLATAFRAAMDAAPPGSGVQLVASRGYVAARGTGRRRTGCAAGSPDPTFRPGLEMDAELAVGGSRPARRSWVRSARREIEAEYEADHTAQGAERAARTRALLPDPAGKAEAWRQIMNDDSLSNRLVAAAADGFWHPRQDELTRLLCGAVTSTRRRRWPADAAPRSSTVCAAACVPAVRRRRRHPRGGRPGSWRPRTPNPVLARVVVDLADELRRALAAADWDLFMPPARPRRARRVGIMGGTFDPIHHGHLVAASEVASRFDLDEVVFVPTGEPWQKPEYEVSPPEDRYLMTVIATASNPRFRVSRVDIDRPGPTYTVDTLRDLRTVYGPEVELYFITGADALDRILSWKDADKVFELAHFIGVDAAGLRAVRRPPPRGHGHAWCRYRPWRSRRRTAGRGWPPGCRSGTWSPTASCSTSPSATSLYSDRGEPARTRSPQKEGRTYTCRHPNVLWSWLSPRRRRRRTRRRTTSRSSTCRPVGHHRRLGLARRPTSGRFSQSSTPSRNAWFSCRGRLSRYGARVSWPGRWALLDYIDAVVHVQHAEEREFYSLDRLWKGCPRVPFVDRDLSRWSRRRGCRRAS